MSSDLASALSALAAAAIALGALVVSTIAYGSQRLALLSEMRQRWEEIRPSWATTVLLWNPDFWYYSDATPSERARVATLQQVVTSAESYVDHIELLRSESAHIRNVARFFAYVADAVLRRRISLNEAYMIFGPEVIRLRPAVVWAAGAGREIATAMPTYPDPKWIEASDQIPSTAYFAEQADVVALIDLLSGEMSRIGDTRAHYLLMRADELEANGAGRLARRNIRERARSRGNFALAWVLSQRTSYSAAVPFRSIQREPAPLLNSEWAQFIRTPAFGGRAVRAKYERLVKRARQ